MFHSLTAVGRLGRDPELRYTEKGTAMATFSMACDSGFGENKKTVWFRVTCFGKTAEAVNEYAKKGMPVVILGELSPDKATGSPRIYNSKETGEAKTSYEVAASSVKFLPDGKKQEEQVEF